MPKLVMFDLDGTLTVSKQPLTSEMAGLLTKLLAETRVAIVSGGALPQYLTQVVARLPTDANLANLYILPTSGSALYEYKNSDPSTKLSAGWSKVYEERIPEADAKKIETAAREGAEATGLIDFSTPSWGERIEYRGSQVTLSALGQEAPPEEKAKWDPDKSKRLKIREEIAKRLPPGYSAAMGGATSIDITKTGIDKGYGIHQLCERLHIAESDALYVGDQLVAGGNDEAVFRTATATHAVASLEDTEAFIRDLLGGLDK